MILLSFRPKRKDSREYRFDVNYSFVSLLLYVMPIITVTKIIAAVILRPIIIILGISAAYANVEGIVHNITQTANINFFICFPLCKSII